MNDVKRYKAVINDKPYKPYAYCEESSDGIYVRLEDYTALQEQLTATTNSLTNAQEALKSAAIEADTVQAGVMGLKAQRDALAAENAALKGFGDKLNDMHNKLNGEGTGIQGRAEVACQQVALEAAMDEFDTIIIPATDAYLNSVRAEGVEMFANHFNCPDISDDILEFAAQLRAGNAGKDGV